MRGLRNEYDVVFVLPHMGSGGAQRVVSLVANAWARQGKCICVLTWEDRRPHTHKLEPTVAQVELKSFSRGSDHSFGSIQLIQLRAWDVLNLMERRLRPKWPWRKNKTMRKANMERELQSLSRSRRSRRAAVWCLAALSERGSNIILRSVLQPVRKLLLRLVLGSRMRLLAWVLKQLPSPVVVSFLTSTNLFVIAAMQKSGRRIVISERNDPELQKIAEEWRGMRSLLYPQADFVTSNSEGVLAKMASFVPQSKLRLLPNPVALPNPSIAGRPREQRFVTVARLVHQKGIDVLLKAFSKVADELPEWSCDIVGDGPLLETLKKQAKRLGISDRVLFHGHIKDPTEALRRGRIFVLPSRFEGMPNALLEAMACGLAPIVTDASPGPLECVRTNETGLVVPTEDVDELSEAMLLLARDPAYTERLAQQAALYVQQHDWRVVEPLWVEAIFGQDDAASSRLSAMAPLHESAG